MIATSDRFVTAIALEEVDPQFFDVAFQATPQYVPWPKAYGGDMVAQTLAAAAATVANDRVVHSMHSYFLRPVDIAVPVRYEVELLRDGRKYSTRQVRGYQSGKAVTTALLSFHTGAESEEFQQPMPVDPPPALTGEPAILSQRPRGQRGRRRELLGVWAKLRHATPSLPDLPRTRRDPHPAPGRLGAFLRHAR